MQSVPNQFLGLLGEQPAFRWARYEECQLAKLPPVPPSPRILDMLLTYPRPLDLPSVDLFSAHEAILCGGKPEKYEPLKDEPNLYLKFADTYCGDDAEFGKRAVTFVRCYGLPRHVPVCEERYGCPGLPLDTFGSDVQAMSRAVKLLAAVDQVRRGGDSRELSSLVERRPGATTDRLASTMGTRAALVLQSMLELTNALSVELDGVRLLPMPDVATLLDHAMSGKSRKGGFPSSILRILPQYTCDSLRAAMWLQVYVAATEQRIVRGRCKGCGQPFEAKDRRQVYCDPYCRHAANQRSYYYSHKKQRRRAK